MADESLAQECVLQAEDSGKQRFCECGQPFETNRETQKRCRNCRKAFRNRNKASKRKITKAEFCGPPKPRGPYLHKLPKSMSCRVCGVEFTPKVPKACYCSNECKLARDYEDRRYRYAEKRGFVDLRKSPKHSDRECLKCWKTYRPTSSRQKMCKTCKDAMELRVIACNDCGTEFKQNSGTHRLCSVCRKARKNKLDRARYRQKMNGLDNSQKGYREKTCRDCQCRFKPNGATQKMCKACSAAATRKWNSEKSKIEKHKEKSRQWVRNNRHRLRKYKKDKYDSDPAYRLACCYRTIMRDAFRRRGVVKECKFSEVIGIGKDGFVAYLTSHHNALENGFTSDNYGSTWEVDHIRPIASFDLSDQAQVLQAFHYTNCQPLSVRENRSKNSRYKGTLWRLGKPVDSGLVLA